MSTSLALVNQNTQKKRILSEDGLKTKRNDDLENGFLNSNAIKEHDNLTGLKKLMIVEEDNSLDSDSDQDYICQTN